MDFVQQHVWILFFYGEANEGLPEKRWLPSPLDTRNRKGVISALPPSWEGIRYLTNGWPCTPVYYGSGTASDRYHQSGNNLRDRRLKVPFEESSGWFNLSKRRPGYVLAYFIFGVIKVSLALIYTVLELSTPYDGVKEAPIGVFILFYRVFGLINISFNNDFRIQFTDDAEEAYIRR
ncbi:hypothetical protein EVAR_40428_1 [Eumeta japonica]|uniref:Uncharacterized protein n=1 Tax=Eumeta variegata TaxID=151549 RepID=A0A4C1SBW6_EUMVA|nr:hypothetical protein EVAR_40428_1 [Eumeta japonica]